MFVLDTQLLLWAAFEPKRLSAKAAALLASRNSSLAFSLANVWEVAIKTSLGRAGFSVDLAVPHRGLLAEGLVELPL